MSRESFEAMLDEAIEQLPEEFRAALDNVSILVQDWPDKAQLRGAGMRDPYELLGLYQGVPQIDRGSQYNMALPDTITLFRKPIEAQCSGEDDLREQIAETLCHEIAHHFGTDEGTMRSIEKKWKRRR